MWNLVFRRLALAAVRRPQLVLWLVLIVTLPLVYSLGLVRLQTDGAALLPELDQTVIRTEEDRRTFNDPQQIIVLVTSREAGPSLDSAEGLCFLRRAQEALAELPAVQGDRTRSLAALVEPPETLARIEVRRYLDWIPEDRAQLRYLVHRLRSHALVDGLFLSTDGCSAALYVPLADGHERADLVRQVGRWADTCQCGAFDVRLTGPLVAEVLLGEMVLRDLIWLTPLMIVVIVGALRLTLPSFAAVVIPLAEVLVVLIWTLGVMALCSVPLTLVTSVLPVILMAISIADEIHLLRSLQRHLALRVRTAGQAPSRAEARTALAAALDEVGEPIALTSVTTSLGFLSFLSASVGPVRHLGLFTALGVFLAMLLSFTLIPALILMLPPDWLLVRGRQPSPWGRRMTEKLRSLLLRHGRPCLLLGLGLAVVSIPGAALLTVQDSWVDNLDPQSDPVSAEQGFGSAFWGSYRLDIVLEGPAPGYFRQRAGIQVLEQVEAVARDSPHVGGAVSLLDLYRPLARAQPIVCQGELSSLGERSLERVAGLANMLRRSIDLDHLLSDDAGAARLRLFVRDADYQRADALRQHLTRQLPRLLDGDEVQHHLSGDLPVALSVVRSIVINQMRSIAWTLLGVALLLLVVFRSLRLATAVMTPIAAAVLIMLGGLGYSGVPLGIASSMFAALTVGIGVDFALHLTHSYRRSREGRSHQQALAAAISATGHALVTNLLVLAAGFSVLTLSSLRPNQVLGVLLSLAMLACFLATFLALPALLRRIAGRSDGLPAQLRGL